MVALGSAAGAAEISGGVVKVGVITDASALYLIPTGRGP
jgi:hypothetical protein